MTTPARIGLVVAALALLALAALVAASVASRRKAPPARVADGLAPCPGTPNCVSSLAPNAAQQVEPIALPRGLAAPEEALAELLSRWPGARLAVREGAYLRAEVETPLLRFVDDLELLVDASAGVAHVRSASRVGRSDLGANRRRVEALRAAVARLGAAVPRPGS